MTHAGAAGRGAHPALGASGERLRHLVELGIINPTPQGCYRSSDIQRIRVVDALADAGFAPEQLAELIAAGAYNLDWTSVVFPEPTARVATTLEQTAADASNKAVRYEPVGPVSLKGLTAPITLYTVVGAG